MKLIVGLGNPGKEYAKTRHNAGFLCLDFLQQAWGFAAFASDKQMSADMSHGTLGTEKILLVKPGTFMNDSGSAVQKLLHFYKLSPADLIVIHDDLDIAPGTCKTTASSRSAGHNGVQDIIDKLGTQDFFRIRIGIGRPLSEPRQQAGRPPEVSGICMSAHDFVLQSFPQEELIVLTALLPKIKEELLRWLNT